MYLKIVINFLVYYSRYHKSADKSASGKPLVDNFEALIWSYAIPVFLGCTRSRIMFCTRQSFSSVAATSLGDARTNQGSP